MASIIYAYPLAKFGYKTSNDSIYLYENEDLSDSNSKLNENDDLSDSNNKLNEKESNSSYCMAKFGYHINDNIIYIYEREKYYLFDSNDKKLKINLIYNSPPRSSIIRNTIPDAPKKKISTRRDINETISLPFPNFDSPDFDSDNISSCLLKRKEVDNNDY
jgi:hypothetical protein